MYIFIYLSICHDWWLEVHRYLIIPNTCATGNSPAPSSGQTCSISSTFTCLSIWVNYNSTLTWIKAIKGDDSPYIHHHLWVSVNSWGRDEIYPDLCCIAAAYEEILLKFHLWPIPPDRSLSIVAGYNVAGQLRESVPTPSDSRLL